MEQRQQMAHKTKPQISDGPRIGAPMLTSRQHSWSNQCNSAQTSNGKLRQDYTGSRSRRFYPSAVP